MRTRRAPPREVVVRFARTEAFEDALLASRARTILGTAEQAALARLRPAAARRDYLGAHALARALLAELAGCEPTRVRFRYTPRGRPELVAPRGARHFRFSLSHADGVALCAVAAGCAVGADVESLRNVGRDPLNLAALVCSGREREGLRTLPASARAERLLSLWTIKEAVAKATGLGFHVPLARIAVDAEDGMPPSVRLDAGAAGDHPFLWRVESWRPTPEHMAAVAVLGKRRGPVAIRFEEGVPRWLQAR